MKRRRPLIEPPACPYCREPSKAVTGARIYPHRPDLHRKKFFECEPCGAWVGCHDTGAPFGRLANAALRKAKQAAHAAFDPFWKAKMERDGLRQGPRAVAGLRVAGGRDGDRPEGLPHRHVRRDRVRDRGGDLRGGSG